MAAFKKSVLVWSGSKVLTHTLEHTRTSERTWDTLKPTNGVTSQAWGCPEKAGPRTRWTSLPSDGWGLGGVGVGDGRADPGGCLSGRAAAAGMPGRVGHAAGGEGTETSSAHLAV